MFNSRNDLLRIIEENLAIAMTIPREQILKKDEDVANKKAHMDFKINMTEGLHRIKKAFVDAGLEKEFSIVARSYGVAYGESLYYICEAITNQKDPITKTGENRPIDYEEQIKRLSTLKFQLIEVIINHTKPDLNYNEELMEEFVKEYLQGFVYDENFIDKGKLNEDALYRIEVLYSFYGLVLDEKTKKEIQYVYNQETLDFTVKKKLGYDKKSLYEPTKLSNLIIEDIKNKINSNNKTVKPKKEEESQPTSTSTTEDNYSLDEKINKIREMITEYEELSQQEKETLERLIKIQESINKITEKIKRIKI